MKIRRVAPHELAFEHAHRAYAHRPHEPVEMLSGSSTPPIFMWICPIERCSTVAHTYKKVAPICAGGLDSRATQ